MIAPDQNISLVDTAQRVARANLSTTLLRLQLRSCRWLCRVVSTLLVCHGHHCCNVYNLCLVHGLGYPLGFPGSLHTIDWRIPQQHAFAMMNTAGIVVECNLASRLQTAWDSRFVLLADRKAHEPVRSLLCNICSGDDHMCTVVMDSFVTRRSDP